MKVYELIALLSKVEAGRDVYVEGVEGVDGGLVTALNADQDDETVFIVAEISAEEE